MAVLAVQGRQLWNQLKYNWDHSKHVDRAPKPDRDKGDQVQRAGTKGGRSERQKGFTFI